jgi:hypothetical protein
MCRILAALATVVLLVVPAAADEPKAKPSEVATKFESLKKEAAAPLEARDKLEREGKHAEAIKNWESGKGPGLTEKMLELAFLNPSDPAAFDILCFLAVQGKWDDYLWDQVMVYLRKDHAADPRMKHLARLLIRRSDETADLLREVVAKNPDKKAAAAAARLLLDYLGDEVKAAEEITDKDWLRPLLERRTSPEYVKRLLTDVAKNKKEVKELTDDLADKYKGVLPDLSVGQPLPDATLEDLDGKKVKPADLHGKVVVLFILSTRDGPTARLIEQQRDLTKKNQGKPLAVVNVFADDKKEAVADFLKKNPTPGTDWWGGGDNLLEAWNLAQTPATFTVDAKGVIRSRAASRAALDEVLPELLKEAEKK